MAALGFALALAPHEVWQPLEPRARTNLTRWLLTINHRSLYENNWLFFRVLVNLGLARVDCPEAGLRDVSVADVLRWAKQHVTAQSEPLEAPR